MPKRHYLMALGCYVSIPAVVIAASVLFGLIDPELARGHADYMRNYQLLEQVRAGVLMVMAALALVLWALTCYLVLESRQRSLLWLALAAAGPFGFTFIAMLEDRSPAPGDRYQQFIRKLKIYWRVPLEIAVSVSVWFLAFASMALLEELMIRFQSFRTGTPLATIVADRDASSGMWAFSEGMEAAYVVTLLYLLWPIFFNLAGQCFKPRTSPMDRYPRRFTD